MPKENFVDIVGYQFEKVHNGVMKWLLDWNNGSIDKDLKYEIIERMYSESNNNINFRKDDIENIICRTEYSFGRQLKIDLLITIKLKNEEEKFLVIETKVDSIPQEDQLKRIHEKFIERYNENNAIFLLFLFGTSNVCERPRNLHSFAVVDLKKIIRIFESSKKTESVIFDNWLQALKEERDRIESIEQHLKRASNFYDEDYWRSKGYRLWFPLYYCIYNKLREKSGRPEKWLIYSGDNNAVMNWAEWIPGNKLNNTQILGLLGNNKDNLEFYFEFNNEILYLKMHLYNKNSISPSDIEKLKNIINSIWNSQNIKKGYKAGPSKGGEWVSLYKVKFDFKNDDLSNIMSETEKIIEVISSLL